MEKGRKFDVEKLYNFIIKKHVSIPPTRQANNTSIPSTTTNPFRIHLVLKRHSSTNNNDSNQLNRCYNHVLPLLSLCNNLPVFLPSPLFLLLPSPFSTSPYLPPECTPVRAVIQ